MELTGSQFEQIHGMLLDAFPDRNGLRLMVRIHLNENLDAIVSEGPLETVIFNLILWAQSRGRIQELIQAAAAERPHRPDLAALAVAFGATRSGTQGSTPNSSHTVSLPVSIGTASAPLPKLDPKQVRRLVQAFTLLPTVQDTQKRNMIIDQLPEQIKARISRSSESQFDILAIVTTCLNFDGGFSALLEAVRWSEGQSYARQALDETVREVFPGYSI